MGRLSSLRPHVAGLACLVAGIAGCAEAFRLTTALTLTPPGASLTLEHAAAASSQPTTAPALPAAPLLSNAQQGGR